MHHKEVKTTSNTGQLAVQSLLNSELRIRGRPHELTKTDDLMHPDRDTLLLYPAENAQTLTPEFVKTLRRPLTLIAPDGSWRQASKVAFREPGLKHALRVKLPEGPPSEYRLRREPKPEGLATIEAIARARITIPSGAEWTVMKGIETVAEARGKR
jgi:DTW domain-containing protein YfiP